eukprot:SAG31_NODE_7585_length_1647_cov_1.885659_1_plen_193_part_00
MLYSPHPTCFASPSRRNEDIRLWREGDLYILRGLVRGLRCVRRCPWLGRAGWSGGARLTNGRRVCSSPARRQLPRLPRIQSQRTCHGSIRALLRLRLHLVRLLHEGVQKEEEEGGGGGRAAHRRRCRPTAGRWGTRPEPGGRRHPNSRHRVEAATMVTAHLLEWEQASCFAEPLFGLGLCWKILVPPPTQWI